MICSSDDRELGKASMSAIEMFQQLSDFNADCERPEAAIRKIMRLDRGSFWAQHCGCEVGSLFLANPFFPS
jgi:hypothetical protein